MAARIKGLESRIVMVSPNGTETSLADVQSFEMTSMLDILSEGYLGETTERKDDIYKGIHGKMEIHLESQDYLRFIDLVEQRAKRRLPAATRFNVITTLVFPNGTDRPRVLIEDIFFGEIQTSIGSREDYVAVSFDFEASDYRKLF